jgi:exodeoxyribonuclease V alpha subunit
MTPAAMLGELERWCDAGWLRSLDTALARFIHEVDPDAPASLLLATALVAHLEGRGHSGLPLHLLASDAGAVLGWSPEGTEAFRQAATHWPADGASQRLAWQSRPVLEIDPPDDAGASPLVLSRGMLYLRRYWRYEMRVAQQVRARTLQHGDAATAAPGVHAMETRRLLDRLFGPTPPAADTDWQKVACALALRGRLTIITGGPGTGKTYTAARLLVLLQTVHQQPQPLRVAFAAPTGKAAARLKQSIQKALQELRERLGAAAGLGAWADRLDPARTLHSLLGTQPNTRRFKHDAANPLEVDVLFVDEASMVHLEMMAQVLEALPAGARVILLGDKDQLASVEAGAVLGDLCDGAADGGYRPETAEWVHQVTGQALPGASLGAGPALVQQTVVLRKSHRFDGPIGQLALAINRGDGSTAIDLLAAGSDGPVALHVATDAGAALPLMLKGRTGAADGYRAYLDVLAQRPDDGGTFVSWVKSVLRRFDSFRVLTAVREGPWGVAGLNLAIERALAVAGLLTRRGEWYEGRPVIVTRNNVALGVFNGDVGVVLRSPTADGALRCYFLDGDELRSVSVNRLADVETAFAMTVHKSQGSEFDHVVLVLPDENVPVLTRELLYTGITRASKAFTLVTKHPGQLISATYQLTQRASGLKAMLTGT